MPQKKIAPSVFQDDVAGSMAFLSMAKSLDVLEPLSKELGTASDERFLHFGKIFMNYYYQACANPDKAINNN